MAVVLRYLGTGHTSPLLSYLKSLNPMCLLPSLLAPRKEAKEYISKINKLIGVKEIEAATTQNRKNDIGCLTRLCVHSSKTPFDSALD